ncbi:MAG: YhjD/YihY/BrkB family envelope integrity protein [Nocardioidaceae bacterium]
MATDDIHDTDRPGDADRWVRAIQRVEGWVTRALETVPGLRRAFDDLIRVEFIDRALVIAAQSLFAMVPLLVVMAAFTPAGMRNTLFDQLGDLMSLQDVDLGPVSTTVTAEQVRTQTGLVGLVVVLISATSYARALQRLYERTWELPHRGGFPGIRRCLVWLIGCLAYLQILALVLASLSALPGSPVWRLASQVIAGTALWWWSAHVLLQARQPWLDLLPGAALTSVGLAVLTQASDVFMPPYVAANVDQFGMLGLVFATSTWLLVFGGVLVVAAVLGRVVVVEPRLNQGYASLRRRAARRRRRGATSAG